MNWFSLTLGDGQEAYEPSQRIMEAFGPAFIEAGSPMDMAVFSRYDGKANTVTVYFSPSAANFSMPSRATSHRR